MSDDELAQQEQEGEIELDLDDDVYDALLHHQSTHLPALVTLVLFGFQGEVGVMVLSRFQLGWPA